MLVFISRQTYSSSSTFSTSLKYLALKAMSMSLPMRSILTISLLAPISLLAVMVT